MDKKNCIQDKELSQLTTQRSSHFPSPVKASRQALRQQETTFGLMTKKDKEDHVEWIIDQLKQHSLLNSMVIHQQTMFKSDFDSYKSEILLIQDVISRSKADQVSDFVKSFKNHFDNIPRKTNVLVEIHQGIRKGDHYEPFIVQHQLIDGQISELIQPISIQPQQKPIILTLYDIQQVDKIELQAQNESFDYQNILIYLGNEEITQVRIPQLQGNYYILNVDHDSDMVDIYSLLNLPLQIIVNKSQKIHYIGPILSQQKFQKELNILLSEDSQFLEQEQTFTYAKMDDNIKLKSDFFELMRNINVTFKENLTYFISWKAEFIEQTIYPIQKSPYKYYECDFYVYALQENTEWVQPLINTLRSLSVGWLNLKIRWAQASQYEFLYLKDERDQICQNCRKSINNDEQIYICIQCEPVQLFCSKCGHFNEENYQTYHNQYHREKLVHHQHCLIVVSNQEHLNKIKILYKGVQTNMNKIYEEGLRAVREGDYIEDKSLHEPCSCDVCSKNTESKRFLCLNCRDLTLCDNCFDESCYFIENLDLDSNSSISREHKKGHIFIRVFDFQRLQLIS